MIHAYLFVTDNNKVRINYLPLYTSIHLKIVKY